MKRLSLALALLAILLSAARAQPASETDLTDSILRALERENAIHQDRCVGWDPCRERIQAFADAFHSAARTHGVSPWTLAAVAWNESRFNPDPRRSRVWNGERSIMQLKPAYYPDVPFVSEGDTYRAECLARPDACQGPAVDAAARTLARNLRACRNSVVRALNRYNLGRGCVDDHYYAGRVLDRARWLRRAP